ncbi:hypothetical protein BDZ89DRAFT_1163451 [Hymenopellis radicata]|nr:hypothetical protein BDZ89DRAFT_1163451 [Hymenopellis radicata]
MSYHSDISSLHHLHPAPAAVPVNIDVNCQHTAGTPVAGEHVQHAEAVVDTLRGIREDATVTAAIVLEQAVNIQQTLVNIQQTLDVVLDGMRRTNAMAYNNRIVSRNSRVQQPNPYSPLQKTVAGSGHILANALDGAITALDPAPAIGALPPVFNGQVADYSNAEILRLVTFYNEDFGIVQSDPLAVRIAKFRAYISEL